MRRAVLLCLLLTTGCSLLPPLQPLPNEQLSELPPQNVPVPPKASAAPAIKPQPFVKPPPPKLEASVLQHFLAEKPKPAGVEPIADSSKSEAPTPVPSAPAQPITTSIVRNTTIETKTETQETDTSATPEDIVPPTLQGGAFILPVKGNIISSYGPQNDGGVNDGMNIAAPSGTAVRAAENGTVVYAGNKIKGFGNLVLIRHGDNLVTAYAHLQSTVVDKGDRVSKGQTIGKVGKTGSVDRPQLHFEIRKNAEPVDPKLYL